VKVADQFGNGVSGIVVSFAVTAGGGSLIGVTNVVTNQNGIASIGGWNLGTSPATNMVVATVAIPGIQGGPITFTVNTTNSAYSIDVRFVGSISSADQQAFLAARDRLQTLITGDIPDVSINLPGGACLTGQPAMNETVDDLVIFAEVTTIDGPGKILGQSGPCVVRTTGIPFPAVSIMQFDVADLANLEASGMLQEVILHEMMHALGFGTIWLQRGLLSGAGSVDPFFTGSNAITAFNSIGGLAYVGNKVPVENTGGAGTRDSHWRETVFKNELMTGFINTGVNPLSVVTASQFHDLGYVVNLNAADPFTISPPFTAPSVSARPPIVLEDDVWRGPLFEIDPTGQVRRVPRP
jgi:hypothetical protein